MLIKLIKYDSTPASTIPVLFSQLFLNLFNVNFILNCYTMVPKKGHLVSWLRVRVWPNRG